MELGAHHLLSVLVRMSIIILKQIHSNDILYLYPSGETSIIFYVELRLLLGTNYPCKDKRFLFKGIICAAMHFWNALCHILYT